MTSEPGNCAIHIPHKQWAGDIEQQNYLTIERWARRLHDHPTPGTDAVHLHLPHKNWSDDPAERGNYLEIERWAHHFQMSCMGAGISGAAGGPVSLSATAVTLDYYDGDSVTYPYHGEVRYDPDTYIIDGPPGRLGEYARGDVASNETAYPPGSYVIAWQFPAGTYTTIYADGWFAEHDGTDTSTPITGTATRTLRIGASQIETTAPPPATWETATVLPRTGGGITVDAASVSHDGSSTGLPAFTSAGTWALIVFVTFQNFQSGKLGSFGPGGGYGGIIDVQGVAT